VTAPPLPSLARASRATPLLLLLPALVILAIPAFTPTRSMFPSQGDVELYMRYAAALAGGSTPYTDVQLEYPPLAMVPMLVPWLVASLFGPVALDQYKWSFAGWEALLVLALGFVLLRIGRLGALSTGTLDLGLAVGARLSILVAGAALAIAWRFDLFPALLLAAAVWATLANRPIAAGIALGLGVLAKLYPIAAGPALALAWFVPRDDGRLVRFGVATALTIALGIAPFLVVAGTDSLTFLAYQSLRGLQIESIGGGLVVLVGLVQGIPLPTDAPYKAIEVMGPAARPWLLALPIATIVGFALLAWVGWRRGRDEVRLGGVVAPATIVSMATAAVLLVLVTNKVFSIQYVVWLVPFAALLPGRQFWLAAAIVALTIPIHPVLYEQLIEQEALPVLLLNLRNALVIALTAVVFADLVGPANKPAALRAVPSPPSA
jgi:hypothetical protein